MHLAEGKKLSSEHFFAPCLRFKEEAEISVLCVCTPRFWLAVVVYAIHKVVSMLFFHTTPTVLMNKCSGIFLTFSFLIKLISFTRRSLFIHTQSPRYSMEG